MGIADFLNKAGTAMQAPGQVVGGALDMISQGLAPVGDALNRFSMSPIGGALARGAAGASGGMNAVSQMGAMQAYAAEQEHAIYLQRQLQQELEQTFKGQPFNPNNKEQLYAFLNVFGKYFPDKLPDAAAKIHELTKAQQLSPVKGPNDSIYSFNPVTGQAEQVVAGDAAAGKRRIVQGNKYNPPLMYNERTGEYEALSTPRYSASDEKFDPSMISAIGAERERFTGSPHVRAYNEIMRNLHNVEAAIEDYRKTGNQQAFNAATNSFAHILDPGSVVREADFSNIERMQSLIDQIKTANARLVEGKGVSADVLESILAESKVLGKSSADWMVPYTKQYKDTVNFYVSKGLPRQPFMTGVPDAEFDAQRLAPGDATQLGDFKLTPEQIQQGYVFSGEVDLDGNPIVVKRSR